MTYTVSQLIANAYDISGIVSREFETVSGSQELIALQFLNERIADKTIQDGSIPYISQYNFTGVAGQERYYIRDLVEISTLTFFINSVRFSMVPVNRDMYFGSSRANNIQSLPYNFHMERELGGASIYMYFRPNTNYLFELWGSFRLSSVIIGQVLDAKTTVANLGIVTVAGTGTFGTGELVVNGVDLAGTYATGQALATYINTGIIQNVTAQIVNREMLLTNSNNSPIVVQTLGTQGFTNNVTFSLFSTVDGNLQETYTYAALDQFYINYLKYDLAVRLCAEYNFDVPPGAAAELMKYERQILKRSAPLDLTTKTSSTLGKNQIINYAQANLGKGWTT